MRLEKLSGDTTGSVHLALSRVGEPHEVIEAIEHDSSLVGEHLGPYRIDQFVGRGGMARVYRGFHETLHRTCAVKVLNPELAGKDPEYVDLFLEEARAAASLVHQNVVTLHNIGRHRDHHYIEMEFVDGQTLQELVYYNGPLAPLDATELLMQMVSGLSAAHGIDIVHRDVKPANVMVTPGKVAKLADFGLAKRIIAADSGRLARAHMVGTPHYMAPELFARIPASKASDVYAAGVTYYYVLTGHLPFVDTSLENLASRHIDLDIIDGRTVRRKDGRKEGGALPDIPDECLEVVRRCLSKKIDERYEDADELRDDLYAIFASLRQLRDLMEEAFQDEPVTWRQLETKPTGEGDGSRWLRFEVTVPLPDGRQQRVFVEADTSIDLSERIVHIYSVCGPFSADYAVRALRLNAEIPHGSIAIQEFDGSPHFVMIDTYPRSTCDAEEVRRSVRAVGEWSDRVEVTLTGEDRH